MDATLRAILEEVGRRPLRASVITATALMDTMLEKVISAFIIEDADKKALFDYSGCMSTFSAKIEMSYVLGLISKELRDDLNRYRTLYGLPVNEIGEICLKHSTFARET